MARLTEPGCVFAAAQVMGVGGPSAGDRVSYPVPGVMVEIRLLGPVGVWTGTDEFDVGPPKRRAVLALLAMRCGVTVSADQIIDFVWDEYPPPQARRVVIVHISRLRAMLATGGIALETVAGGYALHATPDYVDVHRFQEGVAQAGRMTEALGRSAALRDALGLWRGPALSGIGDSAARASMAAGLQRLYLAALEQRIAADLELDRHRELEPELAELVATYPTHEPFAVALMLAAWQCGRRVDALDTYERLRRRLADELGIQPGTHAQALFGEILRAEAPSATVHNGQTAPGAAPCQLPAAVRVFEGRAGQLAALDQAADNAIPVVVISGMGGVGKTALAVRWARSAADRFPDGQLYVDLRGYDGRSPLTPLEALARLLAAIGVPPIDIPAELDTAAGQYRALLASKRMLVVLDNAHSAEQVRQLLPGGRGNLVIVTSRDSLTGLVARNDAIVVPVRVLLPNESELLFSQLFAHNDLTATTATIRELAKLCGHLPLAIRILAANLATDRSRTPAQAATVLRQGSRLAVLEVAGDPASALRLVFAHSYSPRSPIEQRVFRVLGAAACIDFTVDSTAALTDINRGEVAEILDRLVAAHLVVDLGDDRYGFHDLIRELADEYSLREDNAAERAAADDRLIAWYIGICVAAHAAVSPLAPLEPDVSFAAIDSPFGSDAALAIAFVDAEAHNLVAVTRHAGAMGNDKSAWNIPASLYHVLEHGRSLRAAIDLASEALTIAVRQGDAVRERRAQINLGVFYNNARRPADALRHLERGAHLARLQGERRSEAVAYGNIGVAHKAMNNMDGYLEANLAAAEVLPDNSPILNNIGNAYCNRGDYDLARTYLDRGLGTARASGNRANEAMSLGNLGHLELVLNEPEKALRYLEDAYALAGEVGFARCQVNTDIDLAQAHLRLGNLDQSRACLDRALDLSRRSGNVQREQDILNALAELDLL